jgi:hypothetical protein
MGPALGGLLLIHSPALAFGASFVLYLVAALLALAIRKPTKPETQPGSRVELIKEGLSYVWNNKIVFGSISLDLFAVILGGATALLPVFAKDVLHIGPGGFGLLRAAPAIGATVVGDLSGVHADPSPRGPDHVRRRRGVRLRHSGVRPVQAGVAVGRRPGRAGRGRHAVVYVRQTLVQIVTPDHMRGRVAAVSGVFISASNELGEVESGAVAWLLGPIGAAVFGGVGAMAVTALWAFLFPDLRKADRLEYSSPVKRLDARPAIRAMPRGRRKLTPASQSLVGG